MDSIEIGKIVRFHRKQSGLAQAELAKLAGVGKTVVFDIEKGKPGVRLEKLQRILKTLNISISLTSPIMNLFEKENEKS
jgi:HTH-type transcriptional regulator / antitoxin HipB